MPVGQAHVITEAVTETLYTKVPGIVDVLIHIGHVQKHKERIQHPR